MKPDQDHLARPYLIYLCHRKKEFEKQLKTLIESNLHNVEVIIFNDITEIPTKPPLTDLIIHDLDFLERTRASNGCKYTKDNLYNVYNDLSVPTLIFVTKESYQNTDFSYLNYRPDAIFDFVSEEFFADYIFINRIRTLLNFPRIARKYSEQKIEVQNNLWKALDYSHLFVILLNKDFKVVLANYRLAKMLGYMDEGEIIGVDWINHLAAADDELVKHVLDETLAGSKKYEEFTNDVLTKNKERITVRWFNTLINSTFNCVFSIGVPLTKEITVDDNIDSVRAYFTDIIRRDRTTINAMKEVTMKYSEKILGKKHEDEKGEK